MFIYNYIVNRFKSNKNRKIIPSLNIIPNQFNNNYIINESPIFSSQITTDSTCSNSKKMYIICDYNGYIIDISKTTLDNLFFERSELIGKSICILMNDLIAYLHKKSFFQKYNHPCILTRNILHNKLKLNRDVILYDKYKKPLYVTITVDTYDKFNIIVTINSSSIMIDSNIYLYTHEITLKSKTFFESNNDIIIISIDFMDSTHILLDKGITNMINIHNSFYEDVINLIKNFYYPYIYIHEILGDSYILVLNTDWTNNIPQYCATIAFDFVNRLYNLTRDYIQIRIGISYGKLYYGFIDNHFRFFGNIMNLACRLENKCQINEILVQKSYFEKLISELNKMNISILYTELLYDLKGFGEINCYSIKLIDYMPFKLD